jgi:DNA-binding LacI/PurR family transcriptional regulator
VATTMHDVANLAGVSIKTVSNVINDYQYLKPETRKKVQDAIDTLGYRPNLSARGLRSGRTGVISLILPDIRNAYFAELADAVMWVAEDKGLSLIIEQSNGDKDRELSLLTGPRTSMIDGILYSVLGLEEKDSHLLEHIDTPIVLLGDRIFNGPTDHVAMQNSASTKAATQYLLGLGRKRIVAFGSHPGEVIGSAGLRLDGYREALVEAGAPYDPNLVVEVDHWFRSNGAEAMHRLLDSKVPFDGLVAFNDLIGLGAMRVMQEAGIRIPQDVAVIGFDDIDETRYTLPSLTTINPGKDEIARVAVQFLQERIAKGAHAIAPREYLAAFSIVERESTAV